MSIANLESCGVASLPVLKWIVQCGLFARNGRNRFGGQKMVVSSHFVTLTSLYYYCGYYGARKSARAVLDDEKIPLEGFFFFHFSSSPDKGFQHINNQSTQIECIIWSTSLGNGRYISKTLQRATFGTLYRMQPRRLVMQAAEPVWLSI